MCCKSVPCSQKHRHGSSYETVSSRAGGNSSATQIPPGTELHDRAPSDWFVPAAGDLAQTMVGDSAHTRAVAYLAASHAIR